jgi:hypothetical protein
MNLQHLPWSLPGIVEGCALIGNLESCSKVIHAALISSENVSFRNPMPPSGHPFGHPPHVATGIVQANVSQPDPIPPALRVTHRLDRVPAGKSRLNGKALSAVKIISGSREHFTCGTNACGACILGIDPLRHGVRIKQVLLTRERHPRGNAAFPGTIRPPDNRQSRQALRFRKPSGSRSDFAHYFVIALVHLMRNESNLKSPAIGQLHDFEPILALVKNRNSGTERLLNRIRDRPYHRIVELFAQKLHTVFILLIYPCSSVSIRG